VQDRYAGDIGDYIKLALLRAVSRGLELGVAWYFYPNEIHNGDGRHVAYLSDPGKWRNFDPELFDGLKGVVTTSRSVAALEGLINAQFYREALDHGRHKASDRSIIRSKWFDRLRSKMSGCDVVFADPDNGLTDDHSERRSSPRFGKHIPLAEARALADGRCAVIYHHNSRFKGGHDAEVEHWRRQLGTETIAVRASAFACRTFFVVNPSQEIRLRVESFCRRWSTARIKFQR
jgi:hypothetical protein